MAALKLFIRWFLKQTEPTVQIEDSYVRRKACLVAGTILGLLLFTAPLFVLRFIIDSSLPFLVINTVFEIGLYLLYRLSRSSRFNVAAVILVAFLYASMIVASVVAAQSLVIVTQFLALMSLTVLLSSILFTARWSLVVAAANLVIGPLTVYAVLPEIGSDLFALMMLFNLIITAFILGFVILRQYEQQQSQEVERRYQRLFAALTDPVCVHRNGLILEINPAFERLCDYEAADLIGRPLTQFIVSLENDSLDSLDNTPSAQFDTQLVRKDGSLVPIEISGKSYINDDQWVQVITARDLRPQIQAKAALDAERNLLRTMGNNIPDHIYVKDLGSCFVLVNRALTEYWKRDIVGLTDMDLLGLEHGQRARQSEQMLFETGDPFHYELLTTGPDGVERWFFITKAPLRDDEGKITGLVGINRDITEERAIKARLSDERNLLRALIDNLPERLYVKDRQHRFLLANRTLLDDWGGEDLIGRTDDHRHSPDDTARFTEEEEQILKTGQPMQQKESFFTGPNNENVWVISSKWPLRDHDGNIIGIVGANRDITERKHFENHLRYYAELIDSVTDAIISTNINHEIVSWNRGAEQIYGWSQAEVLGKRIDKVIRLAISKNIEESGEEIISRKHLTRESVHIARDGSHLNMLSIVSVITDNSGQATGFVMVSRDVTEQRRIEAQQVDLTVEQERMKILRQVISDMSHDLKNPLATIRTSLYLLNRAIDMPEKRQDYLQALDNHVIRLDSMLEDLLSLSRLDTATDTYQFERVSLSQLLNQVVDEHQALALERQQSLEFDGPADDLVVEVDPPKFSSALSNLLVNAIGYTATGGAIRVFTRREDDLLTIGVQDNGIGISPEDQALIFERFYRVDKSRNSSKGGSGLGLSIAQSIIEAHGGEISVSSSLGEGSLFSISLPLVAQDEVIQT